MKVFDRSLAGRSIVPVALLFLTLHGPVGLSTSAFGACPETPFAPQVVVPAGGTVEGIAVADFNRDGRLDLAVTNFTAGGETPSAVAILLGDGRGAFGAPTRFDVGRGATRILASDFNADGSVDLAVLNANEGTVSVLLGDGRGGFRPQAAFPAGGSPVGLALGDFNDDGKPDLVVTNFLTDRLSVLLGRGDGSFSDLVELPVGGQPLLVAVGDLDSDGELDLVVDEVFDETVSILHGNGDGTFGPRTTLPLAGGVLAESVAVSDLDADGNADVVVVDASVDAVLVFSGHGDGSFDAPKSFQVGGFPVFVAISDLNGDGRLDLAVGNVEDGTVSVLPGRGDGTFDAQTRLAVGTRPVPVALGDFNGDGALDIVAGNVGDQTVSVLINACTGNRPPTADAGPDQVLECTGDLQATARMDGLASTDPDSTPGTNDDVTTFDWSEQGRLLASGPAASIPLSLGRHAVSLKVTDKGGVTGFDTAIVTVEDTTPPRIDAIAASPATLSPPNHKLVPVSIAVVATDACDRAPACTIVSVTSSEPVPGRGRGTGGPDVVITDPGPQLSPARLAVLLRAEGVSVGHGRTYAIDVACDDAAGNAFTGRTTVTVVPGSAGRHRAVRRPTEPGRR